MQNLAGHPQSTKLCAIELESAGVPLVVFDEPAGEPRSWIGGRLGPFTFRREWVYWCVSGHMSLGHARAIDAAERPVRGDDTRYSGGRGVWGDVIRVDGFSGGTAVGEHGCSAWHIDTPDGLRYFADRVREFGLDRPAG